MGELARLYGELEREGVAVWEYPVVFADAATICLNGRYAIFLDMERLDSAAQELSVLAHETGHCATGATHAVSSPLDLIERHEYKADKWASHRLIPWEALRQALDEGCTEGWQLAERFGVTEGFVERALYIYRCEGLLEESEGEPETEDIASLEEGGAQERPSSGEGTPGGLFSSRPSAQSPFAADPPRPDLTEDASAVPPPEDPSEPTADVPEDGQRPYS